LQNAAACVESLHQSIGWK